MPAERSVYVFAYNNNSKSAHSIAKGMKAKIIRQVNSTFVANKNKVIVNWGSTKGILRDYMRDGASVINHPSAVDICSDKTKFFSAIEADNPNIIPEWTNDPHRAVQWTNNGVIALGRTSSRSKGGEGIYFNDVEEDLEQYTKGCVMWSRYIPKAKEFRVHIVNGEVIDVTEKKLRKTDDNGQPVDKEKINWRVRNHANGFIFARDEVKAPDVVIKNSVEAFNILERGTGLNFAAFDVVYNKKHDSAYVLEANTAPGVEATTLDRYIESFKKHYGV